jgi:hypothetical protein
MATDLKSENLDLGEKWFRNVYLLEKQLISYWDQSYSKKFSSLSYYDLVYTLIDGEGNPKLKLDPHTNDEVCYVFTSLSLITRFQNKQDLAGLSDQDAKFELPSENIVKSFMLGDLIKHIHDNKKPRVVKINPAKVSANDQEVLLCDEMVFAPIFDTLTKKWMMTSPDDAKALLAINPQDQERYGIEMIFHLLSDRDLPEDQEERQNQLSTRIKDLAFIIPRTPIAMGSASIYCVLLDLNSPMEETAFIRSYKNFDSYSDNIFVTSNFEILTGNLTEIPYNGETIDTIFTPIINWQKSKRTF